MINFNRREIILCDSKLKINKHTIVKDIKEKISDQIVYIDDTKTGYVWYWCWLDVDEREFIKGLLCFYKDDPLCCIELIPQAKKEYGRGEQGTDKDPYKETLLVKKWLMDHEMSESEIEENKTKIFFEGSPDCRASVWFRYRRI